MRRVLLLSAALGAIATAISAAATFTASIGATPAFLFNRNGTLTSLVRLGRVPIEFIGFAWFVAVLALYWRNAPRSGNALAPLTFATAVVAAGGGIWLSLGHALVCWPVLVASAAAVGIVAVTALDESRWPPSVVHAVVSGGVGVAGHAWARTSVLAAVAVVALASAAIHVHAGRISPNDAVVRDLQRWYFAQSPVERAELVGGEKIRVVVFTDYQCPACRDSVPDNIAHVEQLARKGRPVEIVVRDFPLDWNCNDRRVANLHPLACDAASAVRLVETTRGAEQAKQLSASLYRAGKSLTGAVIESHLAELGLLEEYGRRRAALLQSVAADARFAMSIGVTGTPAYYVDGVRIPNGSGVLAAILRFEMGRQAKSASLR